MLYNFENKMFTPNNKNNLKISSLIVFWVI